jgi:hypothetical protein
MDQNSHNILIGYNGKLYQFPSDLEERFNFLIRKIEYAKTDPDYSELLAGTKIIFECEFKQYES